MGLVTLIAILIFGGLAFLFRDELGFAVGWVVQGFITAVSAISHSAGRALDSLVDWIEDTVFYVLLVAIIILFLIGIGVICKMPILTGFAFIAAVVLFLLVWTFIACGEWLAVKLGEAGTSIFKSIARRLGFEVTQNTEGQPVIFYPAGVGYVAFWLCAVGIIAVLSPETVASGMFMVLSVLAVGVLLGFAHALGRRSDVPEWIMLIVVCLMLLTYAIKNITPEFYGGIEGQTVVMWNRLNDNVATDEPIKSVEGLRELKLQAIKLEEADLLAKLTSLRKKLIKYWGDVDKKAEIENEIINIEEMELPSLRLKKEQAAHSYGTITPAGKWFLMIIILAFIGSLLALLFIKVISGKSARAFTILIALLVFGGILWYGFGPWNIKIPWSGNRHYEVISVAEGIGDETSRDFSPGEVAKVDVLKGKVTWNGKVLDPSRIYTFHIKAPGKLYFVGAEEGGKVKVMY